MRKHKVIKIDDREITVKELRVKDVLELFSSKKDNAGSIDMQNVFLQIIPSCTSLSAEEILELAPSEIKLIYENFKEVNSVFFDIARQVGADRIIEQIRQQIVKTFTGQFADSLNQDTEAAA